VSLPEPNPEHASPPAAIILAAGASSRMGSPKALLPLPGPGEPETFLDHLISAFAECCAPVIAVLGHDAATIRAGLRRRDQATIVINEDYALGQLSSLQCGLRAAAGRGGGVVFTPVDHALVRPATIAALVTAFRARRGGTRVVAPQYRGRHGHPVCCSSEVAAELLALPPGAQARDIIRRQQTLYVDADDPGVIADIDDRDAYTRAIEAVRP
jgi:molybdenum cofactor cytidylyltransferase